MISTFDRLRAILVKDYQLAPESVTMQAELESLGIDSLGVAELLFSIEDEFRVTLPPEPVDLATVGEVVNYIDALVAGRRPDAMKPYLVSDVVASLAPKLNPKLNTTQNTKPGLTAEPVYRAQ